MFMFLSNRDNGLRELLRRTIRESEVLRFAVAYVRVSGVKVFEKELKQSIAAGGKLSLITCEDFNLTEGEALQQLLDLGAELRLYGSPGPGGFHPKVYIGEKAKSFRCLVGSANLSDQAFKSNVEASIYYEGPEVEPPVAGAMNFFFDLWNSEHTLFVEQGLIEQYRKVERRVRNRIPEIANVLTKAAEDAPEYEAQRKQARQRMVAEMCRQVMAVGEKVHYEEVTKRVVNLFPQWKRGWTPSASIRRDLMQFSTKHKPAGEAFFAWSEAEKGYYTRLR